MSVEFEPAGIYTAEHRLIRLADRINGIVEEINAAYRDINQLWERHAIAKAEYGELRARLGLPPEDEA